MKMVFGYKSLIFMYFIDFLIYLHFLTDRYIKRVKRRAIHNVRQGNKAQALHLLHRKSVAVGLKHTYRLYRLRKWHQLQDLVVSMLSTLRPDQITLPAPEPANDSGYEGDQMKLYAMSLMVAQCNFGRAV